MPAATKILYILSLPHSGSTLLDLLLSGHPEIATVGEAKNLSAGKVFRTRCCCRQLLPECSAWRRVGEMLQERHALRFRDLDLQSRDDATFEAHNLALFTAVRTLTGCRTIVDSSKDVDRLRRLLDTGRFDIQVIHLTRGPYGMVHSHLRKNRHWFAATRDYALGVRRARNLLQDIDHARIRYEDLAVEPARVLSVLMAGLGLEFMPRQLDWSGRERHDAGGNRMRRRPAEIRLDTHWKQGLNVWQKVGIGVFSRLLSREDEVRKIASLILRSTARRSGAHRTPINLNDARDATNSNRSRRP